MSEKQTCQYCGIEDFLAELEDRICYDCLIVSYVENIKVHLPGITALVPYDRAESINKKAGHATAVLLELANIFEALEKENALEVSFRTRNEKEG